jgi:hypothetical protein
MPLMMSSMLLAGIWLECFFNPLFLLENVHDR